MKIAKLLWCTLWVLFLFSSCNNESVIIAVNANGNGYFTDEHGVMLFGKQFEEVVAFYEGFAMVKSNGKWGVINSDGKCIIPPVAPSEFCIEW